jgi:hypothetical protein
MKRNEYNKMKTAEDAALENWFHEQVQKVNEYGGFGAESEFIQYYLPGECCWIICADTNIRGIDLLDYVEEAIDFGRLTVKSNLKIFHFTDCAFSFYFLAKNKTEFKKALKKAISDWMADCKPLPPPKPPLSVRTAELAQRMEKQGVDMFWVEEVRELTKD